MSGYIGKSRDSQARTPEAGKTYIFRSYPSLGAPDTEKVFVRRVTKLGDGTTVVVYRHGGRFFGGLDRHVTLSEWIANCEVVS